MSERRTLVLVAHGSLSEPRAFLPAFDHAETIRGTGRFDGVREAFLKGDPSIGDAMGSIEDGESVVVPLFVSEGYYTEEVIPRKLDDYRRAGLSIRYTPPVGTHDAMTGVVLRRAESAVGDRRDGVGLALVGHGSERNPDSAAAVRKHAARIREREPFDGVRSFFLEEPPRVEELPGAFDAKEVVAVPVFMAEGHHVREDVPERIGLPGESPGEVGGRRVRYTDPVGTDPAIADIALDRAVTALGDDAADRKSNRTAPDDGSGSTNRTKR